jgi:hypothetical protein
LELNQPLLAVFSVQAILAAFWSTMSWPMLASNTHSTVALCSVVNALVTLVLAAGVLALGGGIVGVALASLAADVLLGFAIYPVLAARFTGLPPLRLYGTLLRVTLALLPLAIGWSACNRLILDPVRRVTAFLSLGLVLLVPTLWAGIGTTALRTVYAGFLGASRDRNQ